MDAQFEHIARLRIALVPVGGDSGLELCPRAWPPDGLLAFHAFRGGGDLYRRTTGNAVAKPLDTVRFVLKIRNKDEASRLEAQPGQGQVVVLRASTCARAAGTTRPSTSTTLVCRPSVFFVPLKPGCGRVTIRRTGVRTPVRTIDQSISAKLQVPVDLTGEPDGVYHLAMEGAPTQNFYLRASSEAVWGVLDLPLKRSDAAGPVLCTVALKVRRIVWRYRIRAIRLDLATLATCRVQLTANGPTSVPTQFRVVEREAEELVFESPRPLPCGPDLGARYTLALVMDMSTGKARSLPLRLPNAADVAHAIRSGPSAPLELYVTL